MHEADGLFTFPLAENAAVLLVCRPAPCPGKAAARPVVSAHGGLAELSAKDGSKVMVPRPRRAETVRVAAGSVKEMDVREGEETPPLAFAGA